MSEITRDFIKKARIITPERTPTHPMGYRYPIAEEYFGENAKESLDNLVAEGLMEREFYQSELGCPKCGSINLIVRFLCPKCGSTKISKGEVVEHWPCGYIGLESEIKNGKCPKCKKKMEKIGVDYKKVGPMYKCLACNEVFQIPRDRLNCNNCENSFSKEEAMEIILYAYKIAPKLEEELEEALYQKNTVIEKLREMGFGIEDEENLVGKSGLMHSFYLVATLGKGILKTIIIIDLLSAPEEVSADQVFLLQAKALDMNAKSMILVGIPKFSSEAKKLMDAYNISYVESSTLRGVADVIIEKMEEMLESAR